MLHMYIQSDLFQFLYFTYNMENNGIQNNEYRRILKLKIHKKKTNDIWHSWTCQSRKSYSYIL